ncbi:MAG: hypothetical protein CVU29_08055 [Betaproteobacteria bacterium HGW-Betaproteobacteria-22]|nr:MAG: hypothetical protein CVU29_08055 [Betaproteobacteria bacterium HGW-Betaproteobacteria-22]
MLETVAAIWEVGKYAFDGYLWAKKKLSTIADHAIARVERVINAKDATEKYIHIFGVINDLPKVRVKGAIEFNEEITDLANKHLSKIELNEMHGLVLDWDGVETTELNVQTADFAHVQAMRELGERPQILSAGAVLVCPEKRCILVHKRSESSATYPSRLHILGGGYKPPVMYKKIDNPGDRSSLEFTMIREVFEESGLILRRYHEPIAVAQELDTGFIQYVYLGVRVTSQQYEQLEANTEGRLLPVGFDELVNKLKNNDIWVPTGRAHILMWLGLGAPGAGFFRPRFDGKTAREAFDEATK